MAADGENPNVYLKGVSNEKHAFLSQLNHLIEKNPNDSLLFIVRNRSEFLTVLQEKDTNNDTMSSAVITLGKACNADNHHRKTLNKLMINLSSSMDPIVINLQRYLISLKKMQMLEKHHLDALLYLTEFLKNLQLTLPSSSLDSMHMLLPSLESTCDRVLINHKELNITIRENLNLIKEEHKQFFENISFNDKKKLSENEKLQLNDPPESFRSLSVLPTVDDVDMPCSFLRPNLTKGRYKDAEHYLDVQFRLLREDYIKPLRDGVAEYRRLKKDNKSLRDCKHVRVYCNASVQREEFVDGELLHVIKFQDKFFSTIKWETSKRFLTGNLLCLSTDDFCTMLFATVVKRDPEELAEGLLLVKFVEIDEKTLNLDFSINYTVIEVPTLFESYRHNLKVLQQLDENSLPMKNYIVNVDKKVSKPEYLQLATVFDMRPLLCPLEMASRISYKIEKENSKKVQIPDDIIELTTFNLNFDVFESISSEIDEKKDPESFPLPDEITELTTSELSSDESQTIALKSVVYKNVQVTDESEWPSAIQLKLDESQYIALKSAITKEFSIIQGPPGTGKTYIGLRIVQLLLHNLNVWFNNEEDSLPLLIVCYTNHALDQFLEGILQFTKNIVRIGSRSSSETINKFQIKNLVRYARRMGDIDGYIENKISEARVEIEKIKKKIESIESSFYSQSMNKILNEDVLRSYIPSIQFKSLERTNRPVAKKSLKTKGKIFEWLEIDTFNNCQVIINNDKGEHLIDSNDIHVKELENEEEADIEFTENQRNIDYYDFNDRIVLRDISKSDKNIAPEQEWQHKNNKQKQANYIKNSLENNPVMKEKRALRIKNIWMLPINERWQLYKFWLACFLEDQQQIYVKLQERLKVAFEELSKTRTLEDLCVLKRAKVVGMTTTGAAKYRHIIEARNPLILIVEEAAEILESHIITSLTSKTKHVILIGDQQQLRPSPTVYALAEKYGMNVSLFERMIMNGMDYCRLSLQHRMRPEIAALIVPHIYTDLVNHEVVTKLENIKGVGKNVFFVTHNFDELQVQDSKSKVNEHEAQFIIKLCKYLIQQGYKSSQITILTSYSGQLFVLKKLAAKENICVRVTVVDNFQGEENDIILISFVRSNNEGDIGFLKTSNRVCVALSRAKKGLYCIGNFALLAKKSKLWKGILETLTTNKCIGPSMCLTCQNHPDVFTDVAKDSDFNAVPEGGCTLKCEYRLPCGHSCSLPCHPYDSDHEEFTCKKPCIKTCEIGHPCQKECFMDCKPCLVTVEKVLSRCGHKVTTSCGKRESGIECGEPCKKSCKHSHPCPKKCFERCGSCDVIVDKTLTKCKHTVKAACGAFEGSIKCENQCIKTCSRNHPCQRKCFEECGSCDVIIEKTLNCGHVIMEPCGKNENKTSYSSRFGRFSFLLHKSKINQTCERKCLQLVETKSAVCGHTFMIECCFAQDSVELAKKCPVPCKEILLCGHTCKGTCSACKQGNAHIVCNETCQNLLLCGHLCSNKCTETCVVNCNKVMQISSPVCGHLLTIECYFVDNLNEVSKRCLKPCREILPCGHTCGGSCGSCYQGRLHVPCREICNKTLICGHKCESKCCFSCPPCKKPCESRCVHKKCPKKCGELCVKCVKPCTWSCSHKKCTRRCSEVCDRDACNEKCSKKLPCGHPCVGFCGESCPEECFLCNETTLKENSPNITNEISVGYIYLEDCKHTVKENDLRMWLTSNSSRLHEIKLKTCPQCGTIIRMNSRFNKIVKKCLSDVEEIKEVSKYNRNNNLRLQRNLLKQINESHSNINYLYTSVIKVLSGGHVRDIFELTNVENIMNLAKEIELEKYGLYSMFALTPFMENLIVYMRSCREWMIEFIGKHFMSVSEYQLQQLSVEIYRMRLLSFLLSTAKQKHFASFSPEFQIVALSLINFKALSDENVEFFKSRIISFVASLKDIPMKCSPEEVVNMSAVWYRCSKGHVICSSDSLGASERETCYKCRKATDNEKLLNSSSEKKDGVESYSKTIDYVDVEEALEENGIPILNDTKNASGKFYKKADTIGDKMGPVDNRLNFFTKFYPRIQSKFSPDSELTKSSHKFGAPGNAPRMDIHNVYQKSFANYNDKAFLNPTKPFNKPFSNPTYKKPFMKSGRPYDPFRPFPTSAPAKTFANPVSEDNLSQENTEKMDDKRFSNRPFLSRQTRGRRRPFTKPVSKNYF